MNAIEEGTMKNKPKNKKSYTALMKENRELRKENKELARLAKRLEAELCFAERNLEYYENQLDGIREVIIFGR